MSLSIRVSSAGLTISSAYSVRGRVPAVIGDLSLTKQSFKDDCDVNKIVSRFIRTGILPEGKMSPRFGDAVAPDFQEALNTVIAGEQAFNSLSAAVRKRFDNSAVSVLEFLADPANRDEAVSLGLIDKPAPVLPDPPPSGSTAITGAGV